MIVVEVELPLQGEAQAEEITLCYACLFPTDRLKPCALCGKWVCAVCRRVQGGIVCLECVEQKEVGDI